MSANQERRPVDTLLTTSPSVAARHLREGRLVAFPTETVYGLGADALNENAVRGIFEAKGRPADNPLIVHLAARGQVRQVVSRCPEVADALLDSFAPGPLTLILPKHPDVPSVVTAGLDTVGVRIPSHPVAQSFLRAAETPVAAPSANRSGRPSPTSWEAVREDLGGRIACILKGGRTDAGVESTVLDCTARPPRLLRPGAISLERLREQVGRIELPGEDADETARSPGTKHRHYAPAAQVVLVEEAGEARPGEDAAYIGLEPPSDAEAFREVCVAPDPETYARELFHFFRRCDRAGCTAIYAQCVADRGIGRALNDRIRRAAAR